MVASVLRGAQLLSRVHIKSHIHTRGGGGGGVIEN